MQKDFKKWHILKADIEADRSAPLFNERDIWWCSIGANIGAEEDGKNEFFERPVLVFRKFSKDMFWGLPITSTEKYGSYYFSFIFKDHSSTILLSQLRVFSAKRLIRRMGYINGEEYNALANAIKIIFP